MKRSQKLAISIAAALLLVVALRATLLDFFVVEGDSMEPCLSGGAVVMIWKPAYALTLPLVGEVARFSDPARDDIVVVPSPLDGERVVKRVAWVGPERLKLGEDGVSLEGGGFAVPLDPDQAGWFSSGALVPAGWTFIVGDNRDASVDSRDYGCVRIDSIEGKVILIKRNDGE